MPDTEALIESVYIDRVYAAFNRRDIDGVFALMSDHVDWPKASEGGRAKGKAEIREYWTRQWAEFDPRVDPLEVSRDETGLIHVRVHQLVKSLDGGTLFDGEVWHAYTIVDGLIERMDIAESGAGSQQASAAFSRTAQQKETPATTAGAGDQ